MDTRFLQDGFRGEGRDETEAVDWMRLPEGADVRSAARAFAESAPAAPAISRRAFFSAAAIVGGLCFLGSVTHGNAVVNAYADEAGNESFLVVVMRMDQISVMAVDARDIMKPVEGMHVKITSGFNDKTSEGTTDEFGVLLLDIADLAEESVEEIPQQYTCYVQVETECPGYRDFAAERVFVRGGAKDDQTATFTIYGTPYDEVSGEAYVRIASFNGTDVQYYPATMPKFEENDFVHDLKLQVVARPGKDVAATFLANGQLLAGPAEGVTGSDGRVDLHFKGDWVKTQAVGTQFAARFSVGGTTWEMPLRLAITEPEVDLTAPVITDKATVSIGTGLVIDDPKLQVGGEGDEAANDTVALAANSWMPTLYREYVGFQHPFIKGGVMKLNASMPYFPLFIAMTPEGGFGFSGEIKPVSIFNSAKGFNKNAFFNNEGWKEWGWRECKNDWETNFWKGFDKAMSRYNAAKEGGHGKDQLFGGINADFRFLVMALFYPQTIKSWSGTIKALATISVAAEFGAQFVAPVISIPMFVAFDIVLFCSLSVEAGMTFEKHPEFFFDDGPMGQGGAIINLLIEGGATVGVGIKGIASVGPRGFFRLALMWGWQKKPRPELPWPHYKVTMAYGMQIAVQVFIAKFSFDVTHFDSKVLKDNWDGATKLSATKKKRWLNPAFDVNESGFALSTTAELLGEREGGEMLTARVNAQGVVHSYNLSSANNAVATHRQLQSTKGFGLYVPYAEGAEVGDELIYDIRKGVRPTLQGTLGTAVFSDSRMKAVQLGHKVYQCRLAIVEVDVSEAVTQGTAKLMEQDGMRFVVPQANEGLLQDAGVAGTGAPSSPWPVLAYVEPETAKSALRDGANGTESEGQETEDQLAASTLGALVLRGGVYGAVRMQDEQAENAKASPAIAQVVVPRFGDESIDEMNERMQAIAGFLSIENNSASSGLLQGATGGVAAAAPVQGAATTSVVRVLVTPYNLNTNQFEASDVLDFVIPSANVQTMRCNTNDVDFNVISDGEALRFALVSASRPWNARKTFEEQKDCLFSTSLRYDPAADLGMRVSEVNTNLAMQALWGDYEWAAMPVMVKRDAANGVAKDYVCMATVRGRGQASVSVRAAAEGTAANLQSGYVNQDSFALHYYPVEGVAPLPVNSDMIVPAEGHQINDFGELNVFTPSDKNGNTITASSGADVVAVCWQHSESLTEGVEPTDGTSDGRVSVWLKDSATAVEAQVHSVESACNFKVLGGGHGLAYMRQSGEGGEHWNLMRAYVTSDTEMEFDQDMGTFASHEYYASADGSRLFGMSIMEGTIEEPDEETIAAMMDETIDVADDDSPFIPTESTLKAVVARAVARAESENPDDRQEVIKQYQVRCARWEPLRDGYHAFAPYGQLDDAPDNSTSFHQTRGTSFMYTTITKLSKQKADLNYAEIPEFLALQLDGIACMDAFVAPGGTTVHPRVRVTNTGNLPLRGFSVQFATDAPGLTPDPVVLSDLRAHVQPPFDTASILNGDAAASKDEDVPWDKTFECTLWPGDTREYQLELPIPAEWIAGQYEITASLCNLVRDDLRPTAAGPLAAGVSGDDVDSLADAAWTFGEFLPPEDSLLQAAVAEDPDFVVVTKTSKEIATVARKLVIPSNSNARYLVFPDPRFARMGVELVENKETDEPQILPADDGGACEYKVVKDGLVPGNPTNPDAAPTTGDHMLAGAAAAAVVAGAAAAASVVAKRTLDADASQSESE